MATGTNNPPGSTDPRDLLANAQNLDLLLTGPQPFYPDRLRVQRYSWEGMEFDFNAAQSGRQIAFQQFLAGSAFEAPVSYAQGLTLERATQTFVRNGEQYRIKDPSDLPYTISGDWDAESSYFASMGDSGLRQDLSDPTEGASLIARSGVVVSSVNELLNVEPLPSQAYLVTGYHAGTRYGGGQFVYITSLPRSNHDGGTIISPTVPFNSIDQFLAGTGETAPEGLGCWVRISDTVSILSYGAKPEPGYDNSHQLAAAIKKAATDKLKLTAPSGTFQYLGSLDLSYPELDFQGSGMWNTIFQAVQGGTAAFADGTRPNHNQYSFSLNISDMGFAGTDTTTDILRVKINHARLRNISLQNASSATGVGLRVSGVVAGFFDNIDCSTNSRLFQSRPYNGIVIEQDESLGQRATCNVFINPVVEGTAGDGIVIADGDQNTFVGGTSELNIGNGVSIQNGTCNTFMGVAFEHNGFADVFDNGNTSKFVNCYSSGQVYFDNDSLFSTWDGGYGQKFALADSAKRPTIRNTFINYFGAGGGFAPGANTSYKFENVFDQSAGVFAYAFPPAGALTVGASPYTYTNSSGRPQQLIVQGGTISQLAIMRNGQVVSSVPTSGAYLLQPNDQLRITYSAQPSALVVPQ